MRKTRFDQQSEINRLKAQLTLEEEREIRRSFEENKHIKNKEILSQSIRAKINQKEKEIRENQKNLEQNNKQKSLDLAKNKCNQIFEKSTNPESFKAKPKNKNNQNVQSSKAKLSKLTTIPTTTTTKITNSPPNLNNYKTIDSLITSSTNEKDQIPTNSVENFHDFGSNSPYLYYTEDKWTPPE
jgi:hypothetical protein